MKLKQGFGRLIRTKQDTGMVVILDPRVRTKPYGRLFLASLPDCRQVVESGMSEWGPRIRAVRLCRALASVRWQSSLRLSGSQSSRGAVDRAGNGELQ